MLLAGHLKVKASLVMPLGGHLLLTTILVTAQGPGDLTTLVDLPGSLNMSREASFTTAHGMALSKQTCIERSFPRALYMTQHLYFNKPYSLMF